MKVTSVAARVLEDARSYLRQINPDAYRLPQELLSGASIGQHTRHFVEFYQCLLTQIQFENPVINYATRERNLRIESDPVYAADIVEGIISDIHNLNTNRTCFLECSEHLESNEECLVSSSLERELVYNVEHTIHHLAIIKIGMKAIAPDLVVPDHFGVAPSTIKYRDSQCAR